MRGAAAARDRAAARAAATPAAAGSTPNDGSTRSGPAVAASGSAPPRQGPARAPRAVRRPAPASSATATRISAVVQAHGRDPMMAERGWRGAVIQAASASADRRVHVHRHDARDALLLHRHADQLLGHFHRDLVVADEEELGALAHLGDELGIALGVGVVQRRVDFVEQAERRRVQLEDREHQRDRGQRLLAARQQVDGAVLLARRLRHHLHAGVEDLVAGHHQPRGAAAEQRREHAAEMFVDLVEGLRQQLARFEVDLVDRVFERRSSPRSGRRSARRGRSCARATWSARRAPPG